MSPLRRVRLDREDLLGPDVQAPPSCSPARPTAMPIDRSLRQSRGWLSSCAEAAVLRRVQPRSVIVRGGIRMGFSSGLAAVEAALASAATVGAAVGDPGVGGGVDGLAELTDAAITTLAPEAQPGHPADDVDDRNS